MKNKFIIEVIVAVVLVVLLLLALNPMDVFMPTPMQMMITGLLVVAFGIFAGFVISEKAVDEREEKHRSVAGRAAFLAGCATLLIGIVVQMFARALDIWLVIALVIMLVVKISTRMYYEINS